MASKDPWPSVLLTISIGAAVFGLAYAMTRKSTPAAPPGGVPSGGGPPAPSGVPEIPTIHVPPPPGILPVIPPPPVALPPIVPPATIPQTIPPPSTLPRLGSWQVVNTETGIRLLSGSQYMFVVPMGSQTSPTALLNLFTSNGFQGVNGTPDGTGLRITGTYLGEQRRINLPPGTKAWVMSVV